MIFGNLTYQWLGPAIFVSAAVAFLLLYSHDRRQPAALRLAGGYFFAAIGYSLIMLGDGDTPKAYQAIVQSSLFVSHFFLVWGVASLYGRKFPRLFFALAVMIAAGPIIYSFAQPSLFWLRVAGASGFIVLVDLMCGVLVWRARSHRVDCIIAAIFIIQAALTLVRTSQLLLPGAEPLTRESFFGSHLATSMQTMNAMFAIIIGLAMFARTSVTLVMRLNRLAETDPLTGLLNRRAFEAKVSALRTAAAPLPTGLIICDIDNFKRVNDTHGHDVGDVALCSVANLLQKLSGEASICARLGGEEFCILLPEANADITRLAATQLRIAIESQRISSPSGVLKLTASFGYCEVGPEDDFRFAMARTDAAVYQAKADGRNLVRLATSARGAAAACADQEQAPDPASRSL